jgi:hypothetical protein
MKPVNSRSCHASWRALGSGASAEGGEMSGGFTSGIMGTSSAAASGIEIISRQLEPIFASQQNPNWHARCAAIHTATNNADRKPTRAFACAALQQNACNSRSTKQGQERSAEKLRPLAIIHAKQLNAFSRV